MSIRIDGTNTAANPGITGSDTDTGLQFGTNEVKIVTDGSDRVTVDSSGNVEIGNNTGLFIDNTSGTARRVIHIDTDNHLYLNSSPEDNDIIFQSGGANERMRIKSDAKVGFNTSSPPRDYCFHSGQADTNIQITNNTTGVDDSAGALIQQDGNDLYVWNKENGFFSFATNASERMRIDSSGRLLFGKTGTSFHLGGSVLYQDGEVNITRDEAPPLFINRTGNDGQLIGFFQAGTSEGNISVSGSTVSIQGAHLSRWSQLAGGAARTEILRGTVLSNLDEMCEWAYDAQDPVLYTDEDELPEGVSVGDVKTPGRDAGTEDNEQLNRMKVSDVEGDVNVAGVFQDWDDDDDTYTNDFSCAMTGDFVIRIAQGTTVARGDLLMSAGDGTAKPQDDDIVRSKTIAKVTSTTVSTTYSDGSYCVPCVLMAC